MKSLVVFGGALLVAGSSIAGLLQMERAEQHSIGFLSMITGEETNKNVRRPVWSLRQVKPGSQSVQKENPVKSAQPVQPVRPVQVASDKAAPVQIASAGPNLGSPKNSLRDVPTRSLVAALRGEKDLKVKDKPTTSVKSVTKTREKRAVVAEQQNSAKKLIETIRKKGLIAAKNHNDKKQVAQKRKARAKKNITYEQKTGSQRALVSGVSKRSVPIIPRIDNKPIVESEKPATQVALLSKKERTDLGRLVKEKKLPAIDVIIQFDYKSAELTAQALPQLAKIGAALTDGQLANSTFVIAGHTDSVGGNQYNMGLSSKRAQTVLDYLKSRFKIEGERLLAIGYGEERLKNALEPKAAENRRVEFITLVR